MPHGRQILFFFLYMDKSFKLYLILVAIIGTVNLFLANYEMALSLKINKNQNTNKTQSKPKPNKTPNQQPKN